MNILGVTRTTPAIALPAGACDCHVHVFGPVEEFPLAPGARNYTAGIETGADPFRDTAGQDWSKGNHAVIHRPRRAEFTGAWLALRRSRQTAFR